MGKSKEIYGVIYLIRNEVNGKIYIGQTTKSFDERYRNDIAKNTANEHLKRSIKKHGIDNFYIDKQFDVAYSKEELDKLEDMYIKMYETTNSNKGYNKKFGGSHGKWTDETRKKISEAQKGKKYSRETRNKLSEMKKGKKLSKEHRKKLSEARKGKYEGDKHPQARKVICITTDKVFDTVKEGGDFYNCKGQHISSNCKGKRKTCGKHPITNESLRWMYYSDYIAQKEVGDSNVA